MLIPKENQQDLNNLISYILKSNYSPNDKRSKQNILDTKNLFNNFHINSSCKRGLLGIYIYYIHDTDLLKGSPDITIYQAMIRELADYYINDLIGVGHSPKNIERQTNLKVHTLSKSQYKKIRDLIIDVSGQVQDMNDDSNLFVDELEDLTNLIRDAGASSQQMDTLIDKGQDMINLTDDARFEEAYNSGADFRKYAIKVLNSLKKGQVK